MKVYRYCHGCLHVLVFVPRSAVNGNIPPPGSAYFLSCATDLYDATLTSPKGYLHGTNAGGNGVFPAVPHLLPHAARSGIDNMGSNSLDRGTVQRDDVSEETWTHYISLLTAQRKT